VKSTLRSLARRAGLRVVSDRHQAVPYIDHGPVGAFDEIVLRLYPDPRGRRFIQIGANDGVRADPIRRYIQTCGWQGILVEPLPAMFRQLRENHAANPRLQFVNAAVDLTAGTRPLYHLSSGLTGLPDWAWGLASLDRERVRRAAGELGLDETAIVAETVPTLTWADLLDRFGPSPCDLLVLDTEGADIALLRAAPLARLRPRIIHFEHAGADRATRLAFYGELLDQGFELATAAGDTIAFRAQPDEAAP
jgi:FkbM family methyltransferase